MLLLMPPLLDVYAAAAIIAAIMPFTLLLIACFMLPADTPFLRYIHARFSLDDAAFEIGAAHDARFRYAIIFFFYACH